MPRLGRGVATGAALRRPALALALGLALALQPTAPRAEALRVATCVAGQAAPLGHTHAALAETWARRFPQGEGVEARDVFVYLDTHCDAGGGACDVSKLDAWIATLAPVAFQLYNETYEDMREVVPESHCDIPSRQGSLDVAFWHQQEKLRRCYALVTAHERQMGWKYDYVAKLSSDVMVAHMGIETTDLDREHIFSYDSCHVMKAVGAFAMGPLCDTLYVVPRRWSDVVFAAVDTWTTCRSEGTGNNGAPCHVQSWKAAGGTPGECLLTGWLVDNLIEPAVFRRWEPEASRQLLSVTRAPRPLQSTAPAHAARASPVVKVVRQSTAVVDAAANAAAAPCNGPATAAAAALKERAQRAEQAKADIARDRDRIREGFAELKRQHSSMLRWQKQLGARIEPAIVEAAMKAGEGQDA